ncbi:MAG: MCE family protein [Planctomycetes bacterium]|nr:MCE family protein [Planctomycetota bacterium]
MNENRQHFYLGIFVITAIALLITAVTLLGARTLWEDYTFMQSCIDEPVSGLERGSPVKFRGIPVGKVERVTTVRDVYPNSKQTYALVRFKVRTAAMHIPAYGDTATTVAERVRSGLRVTLSSTGITGGQYLEALYIEDKTKYPELNIDFDPIEIYVPSTPSKLLQLTSAVSTVLDKLAKADIDGAVNGARDAFHSVRSAADGVDVKRLRDRIETVLTSIDGAVARAGKDVDRIAKGLDGVFGELRSSVRGTLDKVDALVGDPKVHSTMKRLEGLLVQGEAAIAEIRRAATVASSAVDGVDQVVRGRSRELASAVTHLRQVLGNLSTLTGKLSEYPSLLFVGNAPKRLTRDGK